MGHLPLYKIILLENSTIIFFPETLDIVTIKNEDFKKVTEAQIQEYYNNLKETSVSDSSVCQCPSETKITLFKLMLNMSDDCNLNCKYCYASKYYNRQNMSKETIDKVISKFFLSEVISGIKLIIFFGGEPLLNIDGIEYFINRLEELRTDGKISRLPRFNIITNGTIYTQRVAELFKKYKFGILVSCDGPADIQDIQRPFRHSDKGSFEVVSQNLKKMKEDGLDVGIECTVTKHGVAAGYTHAKIKSFFKDEFNISNLMCVPENMTTIEKKFEFHENFYTNTNRLFEVFENIEEYDELFEISYRLLTKKSITYPCTLGRTSFHILANGEIYPCQLISGMEEYKISHIDSFNNSLFYNNDWIKKYDSHSQKCNSCWAKPLCKFCTARELLESNQYLPGEKNCLKFQEDLSELIKKVTELRQDPERWNDFSIRLKAKSRSIQERVGLKLS